VHASVEPTTCSPRLASWLAVGLAAVFASEDALAEPAAPPSTVPSPEVTEVAAPNGPSWAFGSPAGEVALATASLLSLAAYMSPQQASDWGPASVVPHDARYASQSNVTGSFFGTGLAMLSGVGLEVAFYQKQRDPAAFVRAMRSSLVEAEALALTSGLTGGLKALTERCQPRAYDGLSCVGGEHDAFPFGHTSTIASIAGVRLVHALRSGSGAEARVVSLALAEAATVATGALRTASGAHSWDDELGGFLLGHGVGALVALAHPWTSNEKPPAPPTALREVPGAADPTELPLATPGGPTLGGGVLRELLGFLEARVGLRCRHAR